MSDSENEGGSCTAVRSRHEKTAEMMSNENLKAVAEQVVRFLAQSKDPFSSGANSGRLNTIMHHRIPPLIGA